jgi:hypothetical protein
MIPTEINYGAMFSAQGRASLKRLIGVFFLILLGSQFIFWVFTWASKWHIDKFISASASTKASSASLLDAASGAEFSAMPEAATGAVFSGAPIRKFSGQWKFQSEALVGSHTENNFPIMGKFCSHWGVVTTIHSPSLAITKVAALSNWCTVIVADTKTPNDYLHLANLEENPNVIFLTVEDQRKINNAFVSVTPLSSRMVKYSLFWSSYINYEKARPAEKRGRHTDCVTPWKILGYNLTPPIQARSTILKKNRRIK